MDKKHCLKTGIYHSPSLEIFLTHPEKGFCASEAATHDGFADPLDADSYFNNVE